MNLIILKIKINKMQLNKIISSVLMSVLFYGVVFGAPRRGHQHEVNEAVRRSSRNAHIEDKHYHKENEQHHTYDRRNKNKKGGVDVVIG